MTAVFRGAAIQNIVAKGNSAPLTWAGRKNRYILGGGAALKPVAASGGTRADEGRNRTIGPGVAPSSVSTVASWAAARRLGIGRRGEANAGVVQAVHRGSTRRPFSRGRDRSSSRVGATDRDQPRRAATDGVAGLGRLTRNKRLYPLPGLLGVWSRLGQLARERTDQFAVGLGRQHLETFPATLCHARAVALHRSFCA